MDFLHKYYDKILLAYDYLHSAVDKDGLIREGYFENWSETILKKGKVLLTNVLLYQVYLDLSYLLELQDIKHDFRKFAIKLKKIINGTFWNGQFYIDFLLNFFVLCPQLMPRLGSRCPERS